MAPGRRTPWTAGPSLVVPLPLIVDIVHIDPATRTETWRVDATVSLVDDAPRLTQLLLRSSDGLDLATLQREFRFATPLDIVRRAVPALIASGEDPLMHDYATTGYPGAADLRSTNERRLTDTVLEGIAREYLELGRGSARIIAIERGVSQRTVVSWIEKARLRGILGPVRKGGYGGTLTSAAR